MTVDMMDLDEEKLIEDVVVWTAEEFTKYAKNCKLCLFT
jgi:peroxiredoxin family protein